MSYLGKTFGNSLCYRVHPSTWAQLSKHTHSHYPVTLLESGEDSDSGDVTPVLLIGNEKAEITYTHRSPSWEEGESHLASSSPAFQERPSF